MEGLAHKILRYCKIYIGNVLWIKLFIIPALLILGISNYLDLRCSKLASEIVADKSQREESISILKYYVIYYIIAYTMKYFVNLFNAHFVATSMRSGFRNFFYEYLSVKYSKFQEIGIGEAHYNITRRANALSDFLTILTMSFISNLFFFTLAIRDLNSCIDLAAKVKVCLCLGTFLLISLVIQYARSKVRERVNDGLQTNSRKLYDILFNYERITAYDTLEIESKKYWKSMESQTRSAIIYWVSYELVNFLNGVLFALLNVYLIGQFNMMKNLTQKDLKRFMFIVTKLRERVFDISKNVDELFTTFTNLDQSHIANAPVDEPVGLLPVATINNEITGKQLAFSYGEQLVFQNVNFCIKKGEKIAITGVNGNGKSTFVKILMGFYDFDGQLFLDGREHSKLSRTAIRNTIGYLPQNSQLFDTTIMENLTLGNKEVSTEKVVEYCKLYGMHELFRELGYDKRVGERGKNLSGGQRQKICFMRAVIRNTPALILDEATANMDVVSEMDLLRNVLLHMESKTVIMVVHNLSLLRFMDRVFFFNNHTLDGVGQFDDLVEKNTRFRAFYEDAVRKEKATIV